MATELAALPDDVLAGILRRLPLHSLAAAMLVCKAWHAVVNAQAHALLAPGDVRGIFINYVDHDRAHLFSRPTASPATVVDGLLGFLPDDLTRDYWSVLDHCNGLLLCQVRWKKDLCVCNPVTRRWTLLPGNSKEGGSLHAGAYLAFDPAVSPHYEVVLVPVVPEKPPKTEEERLRFCIGELPDYHKDDGVVDPSNDTGLMEWPPKVWNVNVFSSRTGRWEERVFVRDGEPAGTVKDMWMDPARPTWFGPRRRYAVYMGGALYVHCRGHFIARISLSDSKYRVIKLPVKVIEHAKPYLGRSEKGVYFGIVGDECQIQVSILTESCGNVEWALKYKDNLWYLAKYIRSYKNGKPFGGPWTVERDSTEIDDNAERKRLEWDSDHDDIWAPKIKDEEYGWEHLEILGFHPYKEVIYLASPFTVATYHLNSSNAQYLGNSRPDGYYHGPSNGIYESFVYTPSMIGELHGGSTAK